jgi:hypothetical protein
MAAESVTVRGTIRADGSLEVTDKIMAPPGPAEITVRPLTPSGGEDVITILNRIRAEQQASGYVPRTKEEIDRDNREMRDEWDEHDQDIERLQEENLRNRTAATELPP